MSGSGWLANRGEGVEPGGFGYRPPKNLLGDFTLTLGPVFLLPNAGWYAQPSGQPPISLGLLLPNGLDDAILPALNGFARDMALPDANDPSKILARNFQSGSTIPWDKLWDFVGDRAKNAFWPDLALPGTRNVVTGKPVTIGKWDAAGVARPDDVDQSTIAGSGLDTRSLSTLGLGSGALTLGKRFRSASDIDVSLLIFVDTDAYPNNPARLFSGGGLNFQRTSPNGRVWNLQLGGGRDQTGGGSVYTLFSITPGK